MPSNLTSRRPSAAPSGALARVVHLVARGSSRRPKLTIGLWLLLVVGLTLAGGIAGTKSLTGSQAGVGESSRADARVTASGLDEPSVESVLVRSGSRASTRAAADALELRLEHVGRVTRVRGPADDARLTRSGGRIALVQATIRGSSDADDEDGAKRVARAVAAVHGSHPGVDLMQTGQGSIDKAINDVIGHDLQRAELVSLPVTLLILIIAFAAITAACVPLLLGLTAVVGALGAVALVSHVAPADDATSSLVLLIGLAVGVDYSLFYVRREREARRAGLGSGAALEAAAAGVGRAIVVSGLTVAVALAGLLLTRLAVFTSMAIGTIVVVGLAVIGSVTVLPAVLSLLGDRIDRGRIPLVWRLRRRRPASDEPRGAWAAIAGAVTRHPKAALVTAVCLLGTIAVPAVGMKIANPGSSDLPPDVPAVKALHAVDRAFPGAPESIQLVVTGSHHDGAAAHSGLRRLGAEGARVTHGQGPVSVSVAADGRTAVVAVPLPSGSEDAQRSAVSALRNRVAPDTGRYVPGAESLVSGDAARSADFRSRLSSSTPLVIGVVLVLAFLLLLAAFRSAALAATVIGLNVLSVLAAYGVLVAVFQHHWAEGLLGFHSSGTITSWLPLFAFVILFGLSMDYTVLVLERIREERRLGHGAADAARRGVGATAGTVTSAAVVMVAVFAIFASLRLLEFKQLGVGLAAAILLDATLVRGVALPAAVTLLGERRWRWNTVGYATVPARDVDAR
jgi:RND superfamily putative drug exporter